MPNENNNNVAPSQIGQTGRRFNSNTETPCFYEEIEGDCLYDVSYEEQVLAESESNNQDNVWHQLTYSRKYVPNFENDPSSSFQIDDTRPNPAASENQGYSSPNPNRGSAHSHTGPKPPPMPKRYRRSHGAEDVIITELAQKGQGVPNLRVKPIKNPHILNPGPIGNEVLGSPVAVPFTKVSEPQNCTEIPEGLELRGSKPHKTIETSNLDQIELGLLVDEAVTKPILRQFNLEWAGSFFQPNWGG